METISIITRKAKKRHECNACLFLFNDSDYRFTKMEFHEYRAIIKAKKANGMIEKGEEYEEVIGKEDAEIYRVRQKPEIHRICCKYEFYPA